MAIRKRKWTTAKGEEREAWVVDYYSKDGDGKSKRCFETFDKKTDADARQAEIKIDTRKGTFVPPSTSITIGKAAKMWLEVCHAAVKAGELEPTTVVSYVKEIEHLVALAGNTKLAYFGVAAARQLEDELRKEEHSKVMTKRCMQTLGRVFADAQERGLCVVNPVRDLQRKRGRRGERKSARDRGRKLKVGLDIPSPAEVKAIIEHASPQWRTLLLTAAFTGLRASELRGLRWVNVDLHKNEIHIVERADRFGVIGPTKSDAGNRVVPLPRALTTALKEWRLSHPGSLVFGAPKAKILSLQQILEHGLIAACKAAKLFTADGKKAKYTGLHSLRHFYASWCINSVADGGCGLAPKRVQSLLGHASLSVTMDTYGHLFPRGDDGGALDRAAEALLG